MGPAWTPYPDGGSSEEGPSGSPTNPTSGLSDLGSLAKTSASRPGIPCAARRSAALRDSQVRWCSWGCPASRLPKACPCAQDGSAGDDAQPARIATMTLLNAACGIRPRRVLGLSAFRLPRVPTATGQRIVVPRLVFYRRPSRRLALSQAGGAALPASIGRFLMHAPLDGRTAARLRSSPGVEASRSLGGKNR